MRILITVSYVMGDAVVSDMVGNDGADTCEGDDDVGVYGTDGADDGENDDLYKAKQQI